MNPCERPAEALQRVRQLIRRRRQRHQRRTDDEEDKPDRHLRGKDDALHRDLQLPELHDRCARREEQIEDHGDQQEYQNAAHASPDEAEGNMRQHHRDSEQNARHHIAREIADEEQRDDVAERHHHLGPRVKPVEQGIRLIILSQCN